MTPGQVLEEAEATWVPLCLQSRGVGPHLLIFVMGSPWALEQTDVPWHHPQPRLEQALTGAGI